MRTVKIDVEFLGRGPDGDVARPILVVALVVEVLRLATLSSTVRGIILHGRLDIRALVESLWAGVSLEVPQVVPMLAVTCGPQCQLRLPMGREREKVR